MKALDLFAGTGWGVACHRLGIEEFGVEIMPEAIAAREVNGMKTAFRDVWDGVNDPTLVGREIGDCDILLASPPCQTFSVAGGGAGRDALDEVLGIISAIEADHNAPIMGTLDDRTALVVSPLIYALRDRPMFIAFEQVPTVMPVWAACAAVLERAGYSAWAGVLDSSDYGAPQTRKRAILIARRDGITAAPPVPNSRPTPLASIRPDQDGLVSNYSTGSGGIVRPGNKRPRGYRTIDQPSHTITSKAGSMRWLPSEERLTLREAASIQSYPADFDLSKSDFLQIGNAVPPLLAEAVLKTFLTFG